MFVLKMQLTEIAWLNMDSMKAMGFLYALLVKMMILLMKMMKKRVMSTAILKLKNLWEILDKAKHREDFKVKKEDKLKADREQISDSHKYLVIYFNK